MILQGELNKMKNNYTFRLVKNESDNKDNMYGKTFVSVKGFPYEDVDCTNSIEHAQFIAILRLLDQKQRWNNGSFPLFEKDIEKEGYDFQSDTCEWYEYADLLNELDMNKVGIKIDGVCMTTNKFNDEDKTVDVKLVLKDKDGQEYSITGLISSSNYIRFNRKNLGFKDI